MYNYNEEMKKDIIAAIRENYSKEEIAERMADRDSFEETLNDDLWIDDSVTGNGSGSYTFSREEAKENVGDNMELCIEALREFCVDAETVADKFLSEDWEYFDVTIRCYLLGSAISEALDEITTEPTEPSAETPTAEEFDTFRKVQHFYNIESAKGQVEYYLDWARTNKSEGKTVEDLMTIFDFDKLATRFEHSADCGEAENDTWEAVIIEYVKDNNIAV